MGESEKATYFRAFSNTASSLLELQCDSVITGYANEQTQSKQGFHYRLEVQLVTRLVCLQLVLFCLMLFFQVEVTYLQRSCMESGALNSVLS